MLAVIFDCKATQSFNSSFPQPASPRPGLVLRRLGPAGTNDKMMPSEHPREQNASALVDTTRTNKCNISIATRSCLPCPFRDITQLTREGLGHPSLQSTPSQASPSRKQRLDYGRQRVTLQGREAHGQRAEIKAPDVATGTICGMARAALPRAGHPAIEPALEVIGTFRHQDVERSRSVDKTTAALSAGAAATSRQVHVNQLRNAPRSGPPRPSTTTLGTIVYCKDCNKVEERRESVF